MNVLSALQTAAACVAGMGTLMLGISEENYLLAALAVVFSVSALFLCDRTGWLQLGTWSSNLASVTALMIAIWRYQSLPQEARILAVADLMGYLQFILQFRRKTPRNLWLLGMVSFLQVSVAASLHNGVLFAFLLTAYLFASLTFLALFYLYREQAYFAEKMHLAEATAERRGFGFFARLRSETPSPAMRGELSRRIAGMGFGTVVMAVFFFVAVPRIGQTTWVPTTIVGPRTVGFSSEINLGRSGDIIEDPEVVMSVRFLDAETGEPYQVDGEPYFRGTSLPQYSRGRWSDATRYETTILPPPPQAKTVPPTTDLTNLVRLEGSIEPLSTTTLFACPPWFSDDPGDRIRAYPTPIQLVRNENIRGVRFSFNVLTSAFRDHRQLNVIPLSRRLGKLETVMLELPLDGEKLTQLRATAAEVVADIPATDVVGRAKRLESFLRDEGRFQYTLNSPARPEGVDPLEDFIAANPRGHCEYFAGALTLMLRSVNIPARVVVGYRGGDFNVVGQFYQVRQLHAHSWVEAYLPPKNETAMQKLIQPELRNLAEINGAWLHLDPTTSNETTLAGRNDSRWREVQEIVDYMKFLWNNYVVAMDAEQQKQSVYEPVRRGAVEWFDKLTNRATWLGWIKAAKDGLTSPRSAGIGGVIAVGGLTLLGAALSAAAVIAIRRRRRKGAQAPTTATRGRRPAPAPIDFYVRLEQVLAGQQLKRTPEQTQREFVQSVCGELAETPATRGVSNLPRRIVDAFYRVRFGGRALEAEELREVDAALTALATALQPNAPGGGASRRAPN